MIGQTITQALVAALCGWAVMSGWMICVLSGAVKQLQEGRIKDLIEKRALMRSFLEESK